MAAYHSPHHRPLPGGPGRVERPAIDNPSRSILNPTRDLLSLHHDGSKRYVVPAGGGGLQPGQEVTIRLRADRRAAIDRILLRTSPDGEQQFDEMKPEAEAASSAACRWWRASLTMNMPLVNYRFLAFTDDGAWWYNAAGLQRHTPTDEQDFRLLPGYTGPDWVRDAVVYQIFPDRFADGEPASNPWTGEFEYRGLPIRARRWGEPPSTTGVEQGIEFYGGDLPGIEARLDYLADLGINALYLTPIFTALSNHRYDVVDYMNVDPHLGGNEALVSLRRATAARGIRLILDVVPNHCGVMHPWFQSALSSADAPEARFFTFSKHPDDYACWLGVRALPKLNYASSKLRELIYEGEESVFRHWLRPPYSIDGWRIDVANMLGRLGSEQLADVVGRGIRKAVKEENPSAYLVGEHWFDGSEQLQGDCWDATMNYAGFSNPLWYWLGGFYIRQHGLPAYVASNAPWPTGALVETWEAHRANIPWAIARQQFNLLASHDTERLLSVVHGSGALNRLAVGIQMTYPGVPSVYYGDEIGLGGTNGAPRGCMEWDRTRWDTELFDFYKKLIHLRRTSPALVEGGIQVLMQEQDSLAYLRDTEEQQIIVVCHRGTGLRPAGPLPVSHGAIPDGAGFVELLTSTRAVVSEGYLPLPAMPQGIGIWVSSLYFEKCAIKI